MGTNYYLHRKAKYNPDDLSLKNYTFGCSYDDNHAVKELTNGFVWNNTYYTDLDSLNKEYYQVIHIGKSSYGWHFSLCIYPTLAINNLNDWTNLFNTDEIYDEYQNKISTSKMLDIITNRKVSNWSLANQKQFEQEQVDAQNKILKEFANFSNNRYYNTYDQMLADNHATRGVNGLWKHNSRYHTNVEGCTYDYVNGEDYIFS